MGETRRNKRLGDNIDVRREFARAEVHLELLGLVEAPGLHNELWVVRERPGVYCAGQIWPHARPVDVLAVDHGEQAVLILVLRGRCIEDVLIEKAVADPLRGEPGLPEDALEALASLGGQTDRDVRRGVLGVGRLCRLDTGDVVLCQQCRLVVDRPVRGLFGESGDNLDPSSFGYYLPELPTGDPRHLGDDEVVTGDGAAGEHVCPGEPGLVDAVGDSRDRRLSGRAGDTLANLGGVGV